MSNWVIVLLEPARVVLSQISSFLVNVLLVVIILIIGWVVSKAIKSVVTRSLRTLKLDELSDRIELDSLLAKGGITYSLSELIGVVCYWLAILLSFIIAINAVGLTIAASLLSNVVSYIPNVISAVFVLIIGMFVSTILKNIVKTTVGNAGISHGKLLGDIVVTIVICFAVFMALEQLKIGIMVTELTLGIVLGSIGLGLALAFGLGCRDAAGKFVNELIEQIKKK